MKRRDFLALLGGTVVAWPDVAYAQQPTMPVVGFLRSTGASGSGHLANAFRRGLSEAGFVDGQNVAIDFRWGDDQPDLLARLAADLVRRRPAVIVGNAIATRATMTATAAIPIVFVAGSDPIRTGLVSSLSRPEGNVTGVVFTVVDLTTKRLGLLHELVPKTAVIAALFDPAAPESELQMRDAEEGVRALGRQALIVKAANESEFHTGFATIIQGGAGAMLIGGGPFLNNQRRQLSALAIRHALPAIGVARSFTDVGGLMSYGASQTDAYRRAGNYAGQILKGAKPADLPVQLADKFELVINIATAKAIGLDIPPMLLARADEVIE